MVLGLFGEEDTEKAHAKLTRILKPLSSVRNEANRLRLGYLRLCLQYHNESVLPKFGKPVPRVFRNRNSRVSQ